MTLPSGSAELEDDRRLWNSRLREGTLDLSGFRGYDQTFKGRDQTRRGLVLSVGGIFSAGGGPGAARKATTKPERGDGGSAAGLMAALAVGGTPGLVVGVVGFAVVLVVVRRRESPELRRQRAR